MNPDQQTELRKQFVGALSRAQLERVDAKGEQRIELEADSLMQSIQAHDHQRDREVRDRLLQQLRAAQLASLPGSTYRKGFETAIATVERVLAK